jgi:hypothetical protein
MNPIGSFTNFPQGFANGLSVRGMPLLQTQPGQVFFVDNGPQVLNPSQKAGSDGNRGTYLDPFATINYAVNTACSPGRGDIVVVMPGHAETISAATTLLLQTSGVAIVGLGAGVQRPTLTFSTAAAANIPVAGNGISIQNILFIGNFLSVTSVFTAVSSSFTGVIASGVLTASAVTGTIYPGATISTGTGVPVGTVILAQLTGATVGGAGTYSVSTQTTVASASMGTGSQDFAVDNCEFRDNSSVLGFLTLFTTSATANDADGFSFTRNTWWSQSTVSVTCALITTVAQARWNISDNVMVSPTTAGTEGPICLATGSGNMTFFTMARNRFQRLMVSTSLPSAVSTSGTAWSGHAYDNYVGTGLSGGTGIWISTGTKLAFTNNYSMITRAADKSAIINPVAV